MVARILQLRLSLFLGAFRGPAARVARTVAGLVLLAVVVGAACVGVLRLADEPADTTMIVLTLAGAAILVGYAVGPIVAAVPDQLDPRRFTVFGVSPGTTTAGLALASFLSVPSLALIAVDVCIAIVWTEMGVPPSVAAISAFVHVVTCVFVARLAMSVASATMRARRTRELSSLFVLGIVVVVLPVTVFFASLDWNGRIPSQVNAMIDVLILTPLGAGAGAPGAIALGAPAVAWTATAIGLATAAIVVAVWLWLVRRLLTTVENPAEAQQRGGLGWFAVAPGTPAGAIAARSIVYWFSDSRYLANIAIIPVAGLLPIIPLLIAGVPAPVTALFPVPIMALFFGWLAHNDVAYDATAVWTHIVTGVSGIADRIGRIVPVLLIGIPVLAVAIPVSIAFYDRWALLPAMVGVAAALFLAALGLSSIASAAVPYAVPRPGDGPFQQPQRSGSAGVWSQAIVMAGALILSAPTLWWGWLALTDDIAYAETAQWIGLGTGLGVLVLGIFIGGFVFSRRESRIMEFASTT